jgi:hypothetical protein
LNIQGKLMLGFPHSRQWYRLLAGSHGIQSAEFLISRAHIHYHQLPSVASSTRYQNANTRNELRNLIYPGLAIYRAMLEIDMDKSRVLSTIEGLFREDFFRGMGQGIRLLNNLRDPFPVIRPVLRMMTRLQSPPGYQVIVADNPDCFVINAVRCFKLEVLTELDARELTTLYCKTDDWMSEKLSKVHWLRTKTLAAGDEICDFCWSRQV